MSKQTPTTDYRLRITHTGFTLIEMIVAVSIFTLVMFVAVGSLLSISAANKKANAIRGTIDNLNFAIDAMARDLRTGDEYACGGPGSGDCTGGGSCVSFKDFSGEDVAYHISGGRVLTGASCSTATAPITSDEVDVSGSSKFYVANTSDTDQKQPIVFISLQGTITAIGDIASTFNIQTAVSQRNPDAP